MPTYGVDAVAYSERMCIWVQLILKFKTYHAR